MTRPEYIKCIRHTHERMKGTSWCGRILTPGEFCFCDIDHAVYNRMNEGRLLTCKACMGKILETASK